MTAAGWAAQEAPAARPLKVAVLDFGETGAGRRAAALLATALAAGRDFSLSDRDESRAAARGSGYAGSLNLTLSEARDLGSALGTDFYILGDAQVLRRSPSAGPPFYEAYASLFLVSTRTGRLVMWDGPTAQAAQPEAAEQQLSAELRQRAARYGAMLRAAEEQERRERAEVTRRAAALIEEAPEEGTTAAEGLRLPAPYRRLQPAYTEMARSVGAEAVVDVQAEIDATGEVGAVEVVRWAGYGLDEAVTNTVRQMHFRPAVRDGVNVPLRVLLRYNFRRPPQTGPERK